MMKRYLCLIVLGFLLLPYKANAWEAELFVSDKDLQASLQQQIYTYSGGPLFLGGGLLYSEDSNDSSWILNTYLAVQDIYKRQINLGVGFEALMGRVDVGEDYNVFSLGFTFLCELDFSTKYPNIPFSIETEILYAPPILSFGDTQRVFGLETSLYFHINSSAYLGIRYKILDISIDETGSPSWDNDILLIGARLSF